MAAGRRVAPRHLSVRPRHPNGCPFALTRAALRPGYSGDAAMLEQTTRPAAAPHAAPPRPAPASARGLAPQPAPRTSPPPGDALAGRLAAVVQRRAAACAAAPVLQRRLDEDFPHGGTPGKGETAACHAFAEKVSTIVDDVHADLMSGNVSDWKGAKIGTFLRLLLAEHPVALVHANNAIEERVYAVMSQTDLGPLRWVAQFDANMGGASFPDIVVHLPSGKRGLIDITSDRYHIHRKAGGWCTSVHYVYVAEVWFPSIYIEHLPKMRENVEAGGVDASIVEEMLEEADTARAERKAARDELVQAAREEYAEYASFAAMVREKFDGDRTEATAWMREHGLGTAKGVARRKSRKSMDYAQKAKKRKTAERVRRAKQTAEERDEELKRKKRRAEELKRQRKREALYAKKRRRTDADESSEDSDVVIS